MDWEDTENFRPLKSGRFFKEEVVSDVKATPKAVLQAADEEKAEMLREIDSYTGDDPLPLWIRLIKFVNQKYKTGSKGQLVPLLERCTKELATDRYKDDIHYLRIWIQYADNLVEPGDVFTLLEDKGFGHKHALLYEAHASFLERSGAHAKACAAFELGISRFAAPLDRLQVKFNDFKARMEKREERRARGEVPAMPVDASIVDENGAPAVRRTFAELSTRRPTEGQRPGHAPRPSRGLVGITRSVPASGQAGRDSIDVFVDEEFGGGASGESYKVPRSGLESVSSVEAGRKENTAASMPMGSKSFRFPQRRGAAPQPAPELDIPVDEDLMDEQPHIQAPISQALVRRHPEAGPSSQAALEPTSLHLGKPPRASAAVTQGVAAAPSSATTSLPRLAPAMICDVQLLVDSQGREVCFEELRAEHLRRQARSPMAAEPDGLASAHLVSGRADSPAATAACTPWLSKPDEQAAAGSIAHLDGAGRQIDSATYASSPPSKRQALSDGILTAPACTVNRSCDAENEVPHEGPVPSTATDSSMLAAIDGKPSGALMGASRTPLGLRSVAALPASALPENQSLPHAPLSQFGGEQASSSLPNSPGTGGGSGDDTASFDLFGGAFSGALPEALPAGLEPTVTINTLEAYSEMNNMFQSTLPNVAPHAGPKTSVPLPPRPPGSKRKSGVHMTRITRQSSILPAYATQPLPALHEMEQAAHENMTACMGATSRGLHRDDEHIHAPVAENQLPDEDETGLVYEDTEFLPTFSAAGSGGGDTDGADDCVLVREDTQFLSHEDGVMFEGHTAQPVAVPGSLPNILYTATISAPSARFSTAAAHPDDAASMSSGMPPSISLRVQTRVETSGDEEELFDDQENMPLPENVGPVDHFRQPLPMARALQPSSESRGITMGTGFASDEDEHVIRTSTPPPEILAQAGSSLQDEFEVYCDL